METLSETGIKIAFDIQPLFYPSKSGVGFHADGLIRWLLQRHPENQYFFEYFSWRGKVQKQRIAEEYSEKASSLVKIWECSWFPGSVYRKLWSFLPLPYRIFFQGKAEITHFFNFCIPPGVSGKKVVTVHDLAFRRYPETVRRRTRLWLRLNLKRSLQRADAIVAVSEFTKQELLQYYSVMPEKITVIPNGVDRLLFCPDYSEKEVQQVKENYGITGDYFLYVGTLEPRKNLTSLIKAYCKVKKQAEGKNGKSKGFPKLVLAGQKGWMFDEIFETANRLGSPGDILFTGYVPDKDVPLLMKGAEIFCFVSLYEGFGMPVLEAMACGTPVLTSRTSAMAELAGDAAVLAAANSYRSIANGLKRLHEDKQLAEACRSKGLKRATEYSWGQAAEQLNELYRKTVRQ